MNNIWFTADTHLGHVNAATKWRHFPTVEDHDNFLVQEWNKVVKMGDVVYHLGDVAMGIVAETIHKVGVMNGRKVLIMGNHDRIAKRYGFNAKQHDKHFSFYSTYFENWHYDYRMEIAGKKVLLHHFPYEADHVEDARFVEQRPKRGDHDILLHGHIHDMWDSSENQINVGVDVRSFKPVHIDEIAEWITTQK